MKMNIARQLYQVGVGFFCTLGLAVGLAAALVACTGATDTKALTTTGSVIVSISPDDANVSLEAIGNQSSGLTTQQLTPQQTGASLHYLKPPGDYELTVSRDGYETQTRSFTLHASELRYFGIFLEPEGGYPDPDPGPDPDPSPNPDPGTPPMDLTLEGSVNGWDPANGGYLFFSSNVVLAEGEDEVELFFEEPIFPTTISEVGAFEVELTEPAEDILFPDYLCETDFFSAYIMLAGTSTSASSQESTAVTGIIGQVSIENLGEPTEGDVVVFAVYFDRDVDVSCEDFGSSYDIDAKKGWNTVVQTVTRVYEDGFVDFEIVTKPAPANVPWTFFSIGEIIGSNQLSAMTTRLLKR